MSGNNGRPSPAGVREEWKTRKFVPGVGRANFSQRVKSLENHFHVVNTSCKRVPRTRARTPYRVGQRGWETVIGRQDIGSALKRSQTRRRNARLGAL